MAASLLEVDSEGHGGLRLTDASRDVLTGRRQISMRRDPASSASGRERSAQARLSAARIWRCSTRCAVCAPNWPANRTCRPS